MNTKERIQQLVELINEASNAYYNEDIELMSNFEYDALYDELVKLESETGFILPNSPTQHAGYDVVSKLKKVEHNIPALSLDKTKDRYSLVNWLNGKAGILSWKMDGLTIVANYNKGKLISAITRGNGYVGEDVTHNAKHFCGLPNKIPHLGKLTVRGEAIMTYSEFERINKNMPDAAPKYKNPRNLASATVRLLDAEESAKRKINFFAFEMTNIEDAKQSKPNSKAQQLKMLQDYGFQVVEHIMVTPDNVVQSIEEFATKFNHNEFPSDGLVLMFDDEMYGLSLGMTGKFPRHSIAFKWKDEETETTLRSIEWSASRTGLLNPVAIFDPVEIEGTTVSRASIHNVSIAKSLKLGVGSNVMVYKANLIIPQISRTSNSTGETVIPTQCPVCGHPTKIHINDDIETLYCENEQCVAKHLGKFTHFVERDCANIVGLSESTLAKFISYGFIHNLADIYHIDKHKNTIIEMEGFGAKSYDNLHEAIENSRKIKFSAFLNAIGINGIGKDMAKQISKHIGENAVLKFTEMLENNAAFDEIEGIGTILNESIHNWYANISNKTEFENLQRELQIEDDVSVVSTSGITGKVFVITGSVTHFKNRDELKEFIESNGGTVSGSVSAKTNYLINNDISSSSGKNKKAKELNIPIINEEMFMKLI